MKQQSQFLEKIKQAVLEVEPEAQIILYGSRARNDADKDSDWDFLILLEGSASEERQQAIRYRLYEIEWETNEVLCSIIRDRHDWEQPLYQAMPFHQNVVREGVVI